MPPSSLELPQLPKDRSRLLAARIDLYAQQDGSRTYAAIPETDDVRHGFRDIMWAEFAQAIDQAAWWLDATLGTRTNEFECFAYLGARDLRYIALTVAAVKTGRKIFLPSPFLSVGVLAHLMEQVKCDVLAFGTPLPPSTWFEGLEHRRPDLRTYEVPEFRVWFNGDQHGPTKYEYGKSWDEAIDDPVLILHSSGTTGSPKPITYRNSTFVYFDTQYQLGQVGPSLAVNHFKNKRVWSPQPMAHLSGIYEKLIHPVYFHTIPVLSPPSATLTADLADNMILYGNVVSGFYAPFLIDDFCDRPSSLKLALERLETVQYGMAPLNRATAGMLCNTLHVQPHYASTEMAFPPYLHLPAEDWEYFSFHPCAGIEFCHRHDDLFELVVIRKEHLQGYQVVFTVLPDATYFYSGDLWSPHATKERLWRYRGRTDDIIVTSRGVNVHITPIESAMQEDSRVRAAVVGGEGRPRPFLILEMTENFYQSSSNSEEDQDTIEVMWPTVVAVNERLQLYSLATILKEHVIVAPVNKPFSRLPKGTVDRRSTIQEFGREIDSCFRTAARSVQ